MIKIVILIVLLLVSCSNRGNQIIFSETLFSLSIGNADTDLSFFQANDNFNMSNFDIAMRDGLIYISNTATNKIIEFNSYGNLLSSLYDPSKNPKPVMLESSKTQSTQQAFPFDFNKIGKFTISNKKNLIIADKISETAKSYSKEHSAILSDKILIFDQLGKLIFTLGQEGVNGKPFPAIYSIETSQNDDIIVITKSNNSKFFYRYTQDGKLLVKTKIDSKDFSKKESTALSVIGNISTTKHKNILLIKIDEFNLDQLRKIEFSKSKIFQYYLNEKKIKDYITLPENDTTIQNDNRLGSSVYQTIFDYIGKNNSGNNFYIAPDSEESYKLLIQKDKNLTTKRVNFNFPDHVYTKLTVSPEGILLGVVVYKNKIDVIWWRTDV